jgi:hypothetical protein
VRASVKPRPRPAPPAADGGLRLATPRRPRSLPRIAVGVLLVVGCALAFAVASARLGDRRAVLVVARAVPAGQVIDTGDLTVARVSADPALRPLPSSARAAVVGRPAAVPLLVGTLLTVAALGPPATLRPGEALVGVALKPGQYPPGLAAGARVLVAETGPDPGGAVPAGGGQPLTVAATVAGVADPAAEVGEGDTVVALVLPAAGAPRVAAAGASGRVVLVAVPASAAS